MASAKKVSPYRAMHQLRKGGLHRALNVPVDENIPAERMETAKKSKNPHVQQMANFAGPMKG